MRGYWTLYCYMGWCPIKKKYIPFATPSEYREYYYMVS